MIPPRHEPVESPHCLYLFLNPRGREHFLRHIQDIAGQPTRRLELTTSMPSVTHPRRRPMTRTESHAPDLVTTLTFPANNPQHQISIMILATHLLLTAPVITQAVQSWNIIRQGGTHHQTMQLILATVTLKRYHKVYYHSPDSPDTPPKKRRR